MTEKKETQQEQEESIFEKVMPDSIRGRVKHLVGDLKMPKELINYMMNQVDETKHAAVGIVAKEVRLFLEKTNLADEIVKVLTKVSFEITTNVRFVDNQNGDKKGVKIQVSSASEEGKKKTEPTSPDTPSSSDNS